MKSRRQLQGAAFSHSRPSIRQIASMLPQMYVNIPYTRYNVIRAVGKAALTCTMRSVGQVAGGQGFPCRWGLQDRSVRAVSGAPCGFRQGRLPLVSGHRAVSRHPRHTRTRTPVRPLQRCVCICPLSPPSPPTPCRCPWTLSAHGTAPSRHRTLERTARGSRGVRRTSGGSYPRFGRLQMAGP